MLDSQVNISFYILPSPKANEVKSSRLHISCLLVEKAYHLGEDVFIIAASQKQAEELDDLLWKFKQNSFIPHSLVPSDEPVLIASESAEQDYSSKAKIIVNLSAKRINLNKHKDISRVLEIIADDDKQIGREKYKEYQKLEQQLSLNLQVHKL